MSLLTILVIATLIAILVFHSPRTLLLTAICYVIGTIAPTVETWLLTKLGLAKPTLSTLLGGLENLASDLETHAKDLYEEAEEHTIAAIDSNTKASTAKINATRAATAASNVKNLIAQ